MTGRTTRVDRSFAVAVLAVAVGIVLAGAGGWFTFDDWILLGSRRAVLEHDGVAAYLLRPHNEHLIATTAAWHHVTTSVFGLGSYVPTMVSIAAVHAGVAVLLRAVLVRLGVRPGLAAAFAVLFMAWGPAVGPVLWGMDAAFAVVAALFLAQLLAVWHDGPADRRDLLGAGVGLLAVGTHSLGVLGVAVLVGMLSLQRRWRAAVLAALPLVPYALWYVTYRQQGTVHEGIPGEVGPRPPADGVADQLSFARSMWSGALKGWLPPLVAFAVVVGLIAVALWRSRRRPTAPVLLAFAVLGLVFCALITRSRSGYGQRFADEWRYAYVISLVLLPSLALGVQSLADAVAARRTRQAGRLVSIAIVAALALGGLAQLDDDRHDLRLYMHAAEDAVQATALQPDLDELPGDARVSFTTFDLTVDHVRALVEADLLPTDRRMSQEALRFQLAWLESSPHFPEDLGQPLTPPP